MHIQNGVSHLSYHATTPLPYKHLGIHTAKAKTVISQRRQLNSAKLIGLRENQQQHDTEINQNRAGLWPTTAVSPFLWLISTAQQTKKLCWKLPAHSDLSPDIELQLAKKIQVGQTNLKPNSLWHIRLRSFAVHVCSFRNDNSSWNRLKITDPPPLPPQYSKHQLSA